MVTRKTSKSIRKNYAADFCDSQANQQPKHYKQRSLSQKDDRDHK